MQLKNFHDIISGYRYIYISPHFDDVVYSCSGAIAAQVRMEQRPLVITVFGGIPPTGMKLSAFASQLHKTMGFCLGLGRGRLSIARSARTVMFARRKEDSSALTYLQADYLWLDYLDCVYRGTPPYYTQVSQLVGGDVHPDDISISKQLAQGLLMIHERLPDVTWYLPLGVGKHIDHQIVAAAAVSLIRRGAYVKFYEDFPYVLREGRLQKRLGELGGSFEPTLVDISEVLNLRIKAAELYSSQVDISFGSGEAMYKAIRDYTQNILPEKTGYLERYWEVC